MAGVSAYNAANILNWAFGKGTFTQPGNWAVGLALGAPSSTSASELGTGTGLSRSSLVMGAAASPAGSMSNVSSMNFGALAVAGPTVISGIQIWDQTASGGNMLFYGTLATARTLYSSDQLVIAVGNLVVTLA